MQSFLDQVTQYILENHSGTLHKLALVTPNRRAGLFLKKSFAKYSQGATWAPDVMSMEEFTGTVSGITIQEPVALLLEFYKVYKQEEQLFAEPLEEFLKWAPMLLKDFNDIDANLDDASQVFDSVTDVKRVETWNPEGNPRSEYQQKYLEFFDKFKRWHKAFTRHLLQKQTGYQGLAHRVAAQILASSKGVRTMPAPFICFVGFNALNQAEEDIIKNLVKRGKARVFWDADKYYMENPNHEAGLFLRKYKKNGAMGAFTFEGDHFSIQKKSIKIYGVAKNVNQAKLAANILNNFSAEQFSNQQTAVVLANEELMLPMLNALPESAEKVNITMGFPLRKTSLYGLFEAFFQLHVTTQRMHSAAPGWKSVFYFKDVVRFFRHPAISLLMQSDDPDFSIEVFVRNIYNTKRTFLSVAALAKSWNNEKTFDNYCLPWLEGFAKEPHKLVPVLKNLTSALDEAYRNKAKQEETALENAPWLADFEALFPVNIILRKLESFLKEQKHVNDLQVLFMLFQAMARESKLVLSGEPLAGLQIMGMLETRGLDFRNVIILSANEDILPAAKTNTSLLPYDVKAYYGIPVHKEKDAVYAYHFYRLLQRAENVHIIYNTQTQDMGSSEKSRYITQLKMEMPAWNPHTEISEHIIPLPPAGNDTDHDVVIPKNDDIFRKLDVINAKGFSPTTLVHYIKCSLFFYFRHIAGIEETIAPEETMQANTMGNVVHSTLEQLYDEQNLRGKVVLPDHIDNMLKRVDAVTADKLEQYYAGGDVSSGKNLLLARVAARYVRNYLFFERKQLLAWQNKNSTLTYLNSEEEMKISLVMPIGEKEKEMVFRGYADRIDRLDNIVRVIDYKTGNVEPAELKIKQWQDITQDANLSKSFQLMMYAMLYRHKHGMPPSLITGLVSFRRLASGLLSLSYPQGRQNVSESAILQFEQELLGLMQQMYDKDTPFRRTPHLDNCKYCDFRVTCNR